MSSDVNTSLQSDDEHITCEIPPDLERSRADVALEAVGSPPVQTQLTFPADGIYGFRADAHKFGIADAVSAIREIGQIWARRGHPRIGIGDLSLRGGGPTPAHDSHRTGIDIDIRPMRRGGEEMPVTFNDSAYSRERTQELCDLIYANGKLAVQFVLFNDRGVSGVRPAGGHHNHLHIRHLFPGEQDSLPVLSQGSSHPCVREAQRRLNYWIASAPGAGVAAIVVDGDFGNATRQAVMAFQRAHALADDGRVGEPTWAALPSAPVTAGGDMVG